jgi:glycosyltransferase involved in cell wall biosynthesis
MTHGTLLLFEPCFNGHHGVYLRWLIRGGIQRGYEIHLATVHENEKHPVFQWLREEFPGGLKIDFFKDGMNYEQNASHLPALIRQDYGYFKCFKNFYRVEYRTAPPAFVFLPYLDYCLYSLALRESPFGETMWGGIAMRPVFHIAPHPIKERLFFRLLRNPRLTQLYVMDEQLHGYVRKRNPKSAMKCSYVPDPAEMQDGISKSAARQTLGLSEDALVILVYGAMSLRKGFDVLLKALHEPGFPGNACVILAGRQDAEARTFMTSPAVQALLHAGRVQVWDDFLSSDDETRVFAAADMMWMGYRRHTQTSGVMVQAGRTGLPMIGCEEGMIGETIRNKFLGITVPIHDSRLVAEAVSRLTQDQARMRKYGENGQRAFVDPTPERFIQRIFDGLLEVST